MLLPTKEFCLADKPNLINLFALLMLDGSMCPKCGYGTRKTSKNWRRCKRPVNAANVVIRDAVADATEA